MENVIIFIVIALIVAAAVIYIVRQKKKGNKCIGCSSSGSCPHCQQSRNTPNK